VDEILLHQYCERRRRIVKGKGSAGGRRERGRVNQSVNNVLMRIGSPLSNLLDISKSMKR